MRSKYELERMNMHPEEYYQELARKYELQADEAHRRGDLAQAVKYRQWAAQARGEK